MDPHEQFFRSLAREEVHLIALKAYLYEGSWDEIVEDLRARKDGKPYVYKLDTRIDEDLDRIERLREYESRHAVDLTGYLHLFEGSEDPAAGDSPAEDSDSNSSGSEFEREY